MAVEVASGGTRVVFDPNGDARLPRWSPHGDRLFAAWSRPVHGLEGLRLHQLRPDGSQPVLVIPDKRYQYDGYDVLPELPALPVADPVLRPVDLARTQLQLAIGSATRGDYRQLQVRDGDALLVQTSRFGGRNVAGVNLKMPLPTDEAADVLQVRIEVVAGLDRADQDTILRLAVHNPVENRADTVLKIVPQDTSLHELTFAISSLAHVSRERELRLEVIGDFSAGDPSVLRIDYVSVTVQARDSTN